MNILSGKWLQKMTLRLVQFFNISFIRTVLTRHRLNIINKLMFSYEMTGDPLPLLKKSIYLLTISHFPGVFDGSGTYQPSQR